MNFNFFTIFAIFLAGIFAIRLMRIGLDHRANLLKSVLNLSTESFFVLDMKQETCEPTGKNAIPFLGFTSTIPEEVLTSIKSTALEIISENKSLEKLLSVKSADGLIKKIFVKTHFLEDSDQKNPRYLISVRPFNEPVVQTIQNEKVQIKMAQVERYAILKDLGAGVSHEINNPLAIILGRAQTLKMKLSRGAVEPAEVTSVLEKIESNVKRIAKIVTALRLLTRDSTLDEFEILTVQSLFEDISSIWAERLKNKGYDFKISNVNIELEVWGKRSMLASALFNMISNSFEALSEQENRWIHINCEVSGSEIQISVTDSGKGIPKEQIERIFDPFYTSRDAAKFSGLGLSVAKGIIEEHKGRIEYDSKSENTCFVIRLPILNEQRKKSA